MDNGLLVIFLQFFPRRKNTTNTESQVNSTNATSPSQLNSTNSTSFPLRQEVGEELKCPFNDCVPWRSLILDSRNISNSLNLDSLKTMFPIPEGTPNDFRLVTPEGDHVSPVYAVRLSKESYGEWLFMGIYSCSRLFH